MKYLIMTACFLAFAAFGLAAQAAPLVKVKGGYVDWCQGEADERAEAKCIDGRFAFDYEGNLITTPDGPGDGDDEGDDS